MYVTTTAVAVEPIVYVTVPPLATAFEELQ